MKIFFKIVVLLAVLTSLIQGKDLNINEVEKKAKSENKQMMFFFHIPSCPYCERMLKENFNDKETLSEIKKDFVFVDIFTGNEGVITYKDFKGSSKEFAKKMKVFTYPTTQFRSASSKLIHEARGYRNTNEYLTEIKYIASRAYKRTDLETFSDDLEFAKDD